MGDRRPLGVAVVVVSAGVQLEYSFAVPDLGAKWFSNAFLVQLAETEAGGGEGAGGGGAVLDADAACWIYRPAGRGVEAAQTAVGEVEVEIADEIKEAIEKWSRASEKRLSSFLFFPKA